MIYQHILKSQRGRKQNATVPVVQSQRSAHTTYLSLSCRNWRKEVRGMEGKRKLWCHIKYLTDYKEDISLVDLFTFTYSPFPDYQYVITLKIRRLKDCLIHSDYFCVQFIWILSKVFLPKRVSKFTFFWSGVEWIRQLLGFF